MCQVQDFSSALCEAQGLGSPCCVGLVILGLTRCTVTEVLCLEQGVPFGSLASKSSGTAGPEAVKNASRCFSMVM